MIRKILLVDDDLILRTALAKRLAVHHDSFAVVTAADGFEAVKELKKFPFSLVITDLVMPRMDGTSLISHIRQHYPDLPIIAMSAVQDPAIEAGIKAGGTLAYLCKPFRADELVMLITGSLKQEADGGIMYDVSPSVFLQLMEMDRKTCTIRILDKTSGRGGIVYFIDGSLVDARAGERRGIEAAYEVFTWETVTLFITNSCAPRENVIHSDLQPIIMRAAGMKDESDGPDYDGEEEEGLPPLLATLQNMLLKAGGEECLEGFAYDKTLGRTAERLQQLGGAAVFGSFQAGMVRICGDKHDKIFLPGQPAPTFTIKAGAIRSNALERIRQTGHLTRPET